MITNLIKLIIILFSVKLKKKILGFFSKNCQRAKGCELFYHPHR